MCVIACESEFWKVFTFPRLGCVIVYITITPESGSERFRIVCIWVLKMCGNYRSERILELTEHV